jgi:formylglycine-generating enzyme required for sulfatase activity
MMKTFASAALVCGLLLAGCKKQNATAPSAAPEPVAVMTVTLPDGTVMVQLRGGTFMMGSENGDDDEKPVHKVTVSGILIDRNEVTQKTYQAIMGKNPSKWLDPNKPVERTSWVSAISYCNMRSMKEGLKPCYDLKTAECDFSANGYRLPTEAEWEYACRAGSQNDADDVGGKGWFKGNSNQMTHAVGQKQANAWGLFDMQGNVAEWCNDRYGEKEYSASGGDNPHGPAKGDERVLRGGSWKEPANKCRASSRGSETPGLADACFGSERYGFRCVRNAP